MSIEPGKRDFVDLIKFKILTWGNFLDGTNVTTKFLVRVRQESHIRGGDGTLEAELRGVCEPRMVDHVWKLGKARKCIVPLVAPESSPADIFWISYLQNGKIVNLCHFNALSFW